MAEILTTHREVDHVTFTGSTQTGRLIMRNGAETIKKVSLELGGKSAAIVLDDADLASVIPAAAGIACMHAGQGCALMTRLLVPRSLMGAASEIVKAVYAQFPYGDPNDPTNMMGPLINQRQLDRVLAYMAKGKAEADLLIGGGRAEQFDKATTSSRPPSPMSAMTARSRARRSSARSSRSSGTTTTRMRSGLPTPRPTAYPARSSAPTSSVASLSRSASGPARSGSTVAISPPPTRPTAATSRAASAASTESRAWRTSSRPRRWVSPSDSGGGVRGGQPAADPWSCRLGWPSGRPLTRAA